jgi:CelD/BcsL family acetyltransferase involved in cellulose biosynthesis
MRQTFDVQPLATVADLRAVAGEWDALAAARSPFLTTAWLAAWQDAYGGPEPAGVALRDRAGALVAGAWLGRARPHVERVAAAHAGDWDVVARDDTARAAVWGKLLERTPPRLHLAGLAGGATAEIARRALRASGHRVLERPGAPSPYLDLPRSPDDITAAVGDGLRKRVRRARRALERMGELRLRTVADPDEARAGLDALLALEAAGWKGREGSAVLAEPATERQYRAFAATARAGMFRLRLLELDGRLVAGDYAAAAGGVECGCKTGYDESLRRFSPGLVLRAEVLRACVAEGLRGYEFLGHAEPYKLEWGARPRPRVDLVGFRGARELPAWAWRAHARPMAGRLRRAVLSPAAGA